MPTVADHIEQHRESLLERFLAQVSRLPSAQGLTPHELLNTTPEYIATLAALSRRGRREAPQETKARLEETHISFRMRLGYALEEVQEEYEVMRRLITGLWRDGPAEAQPPDEDVRLLHEELDSARAQAASAFRGYSLQEWQGERRAVRQLDALIPEVIGPADSPRPLRERLAPLVEVVRIALQADEAFLFLAGEDGAPLVPAASARRGQRPGPVAEAPAELASFVARVAASEELVHLPATQEGGGASAEAPAAGTSWLGLRLWPHDKLLGALVLRHSRLHGLGPDMRRQLVMIGEHVSSILDRAQLIGEQRGANARLRRSETALRESEQRFRGLLDSTEEGIWGMDTGGRATFINPAGVKLLGYRSAEEVLGRSMHALTHHTRPDGTPYPAEACPLYRAFRRGQGASGEDLFWRADGTGLPVRFRSSPILREGRVEGAVVVFEDISERRRAEEALREREERLRLALRAADLGTWDHNPVTGETRWDARSKALFGLSPEAPVTWDIFLAGVHPEDRARVERVALAAFDPAGSGNYDIEYRTVGLEDGVLRWVRATGRAHFEGGRAVRFIGTLQDVSALKQAEEALQRSAREFRTLAESMPQVVWTARPDGRLEYINQVLAGYMGKSVEAALLERADFEQKLIGIVSHDLRSPLNAISLSTVLLLRRGELDDRVRQGLRRIMDASERATRMIRDLLDFTRARVGGGLPIEPRPLDLHALVAQVVDEVRLSVPERHIEVRHEGAGAAEVDADRLAQVVTNLLTNALQYSPPDAPVHVVSRAEDGELVLEVHNAGPPIPASLLPSLFEPLRRGQESGASSSRGLGSRSIGLGLYIVRELVQAHGGSISVRSREAEGTTFTVRLPRSPPPAALAARA